ncbi:hypothetical protein CK203_080016 [Vitis vinifera]|uniref:Uncharacterized protein n=1 Tax=Vitis vinifera TaxID=29760 RepID=A0A438DDU6_VITVI|nr:hypothetical protein CK203_080016 [Vitis vinifera]
MPFPATAPPEFSMPTTTPINLVTPQPLPCDCSAINSPRAAISLATVLFTMLMLDCKARFSPSWKSLPSPSMSPILVLSWVVRLLLTGPIYATASSLET